MAGRSLVSIGTRCLNGLPRLRKGPNHDPGPLGPGVGDRLATARLALHLADALVSARVQLAPLRLGQASSRAAGERAGCAFGPADLLLGRRFRSLLGLLR